ncbi:hypothetical protein BHM03_00044375 [Ensete ventricosum]|nr:hypothetical protein BHM03_00044375 [Ensete ventricosum]
MGDSPIDLGESTIESAQILRYERFNCPAWAIQLLTIARNPGRHRLDRRSLAIYPLESPEKWFPPLFEFRLEPNVDQFFGQLIELNLSSTKPQNLTPANLAASLPVFFQRSPSELPDPFGKSPSELTVMSHYIIRTQLDAQA